MHGLKLTSLKNKGGDYNGLWWEENPMDFESWKKSLDENTEKE